MPRHAERRTLPCPLETLYGIVADVQQYPEFLPGVLKADVFNPAPHGFLADLTVGYKFFQETYRSEVILTPHKRIDIRYLHGPFKHLHNHWIFSPASAHSVHVDFFIDFEFRSSLFHGMIQPLFKELVSKMVGAFEERAKCLSVEGDVARNGLKR